MGNICSLSLPLDQSVNKVSQWLGEKGSYIHNLEKNLDALTTAMDKLKAKRDDLLIRLTREEDRGRKRLAEFQVWLDSVETIKMKVNDILKDRYVQSQRLFLCGFCSKSLRSSYHYGKIVFLTLREVEKLKSEHFEEISAESYEVEERQLPSIIVGQEIMVDKAWTHLMKDEVGIMGLYGMGGVGKTTLLTQINNKFSKDRCGFDYVIWVVVSKELRIEKIQDEIAQIVGLDRFRWDGKSKSQKTNRLFNFLRKKKFVLILDDIWEKVELHQIGVPLPKRENECKVAFTTRSREVCTRMGIEDPMEVQCLTENDAFDLFQKKVGQETLDSDPDIPDLAKKVARKCCGLPLALDVIGETMSSKRSVQEWRYAVEVLTSNAANFADMEDKILPLLKYSYDDLRDEQVQSCLLYCALFPEDARMNKKDLIEYWIGEGIITGSESIEMAENKGYEIIGSLVRASLLMKEDVTNARHANSIEMVYDVGSTMADGIEMVHMHDVVREMALWVASDLGIQKETFIVRAGVGLRKIPKVGNWSAVRRMSLMNNEIFHLVGSPKCLKLATLLLQSTHLRKISNEFFKFMPMLVALDLSKNDSITKLPEGISELVSLQYLNLSGTRIPHLPMGLQSLKKLIHLDLERTCHLSSIVVVTSLFNLKVLKLSGSGFLWDLNTVKKLETLKHLDVLTISIDGYPGPKHFLRSRRLASHTRELFIWISERESSHTSIPVKMDKLRHFYIEGSEEITMGRTCSFLSLVKVEIKCCRSVTELTFLMFAPSLKHLDVSKLMALQDIINKEKASECEISGIVPFPKLTELHLFELPKLENIYWSPLPFSYLKIFKVNDCPNLKKLPLDSKSGKQGENRLIIEYDTDDEWIEGVQWEDEATKTRFLVS